MSLPPGKSPASGGYCLRLRGRSRGRLWRAGLSWISGRGPDLADRLRVALRDRRPIDHVPPGLEVLGAPVLVLEVVRVLPDVVAEDRLVGLEDRRVLVRRRVHREAGPVVDQPRPA